MPFKTQIKKESQVDERPTLRRYLTLSCLFFVSYVVVARLSLYLATIHASASPVWPATGLAFGLLLVFGRRYWPAITAGAFAANFLTDAPLLTVCIISCGNTVEALLGERLIRSLRQRESLGLHSNSIAIVTGSLIAAAESATVGVLALKIAGTPWDLLSTIWITWWIGNVLGGITVTPLFFEFFQKADASETRPRLPAIGASLAVGIPLCWFLLFRSEGRPYLILVFPYLWLCMHVLGSRGLTLAGVVISGVSTWSTYTGNGIFQIGTTNSNFIHLQLFLSAVALTILVLPELKRLGHHRPTSLVLLMGWLLTAGLFYSFYTKAQGEVSLKFTKIRAVAEERLQAQINHYLTALRSGVGLFASSVTVERGEWQRFVEQISPMNEQSGLRGLGVIFRVARSELPNFADKTALDGAPQFGYSALQTEGAPSEQAYIITYIEPYENNERAMGLDISTEAKRKAAADRAVDTGEANLTEVISLVQDAKRPGFVVLYPFYRQSPAPLTVSERREQHIGWIYAPIIAEEFFSAAFGKQILPELSYSVRQSAVVSQSEDFDQLPNQAQQETSVSIGGQTFTLRFKPSSLFKINVDAASSWAGASGALLTLLLAALLAALRAANRQKEKMLFESAKMASLGESAAGVVHEINNPLTVVIGKLDNLEYTLLHQALDIKFVQAEIDSIRRSALSIGSIVRGMRNFSRQSDQDPFESTSLRLIVAGTLALCQDRLKSERVEIRMSDFPDITFEARASQIAQIIFNLLTNAMDAIKDQKLAWISLEARVQGGTHLQLRISDSGPGIPNEVAQKMMKPFFTTKELGKGTGLGLSISQTIALEHGGSLILDRDAPHTSFVLELPLIHSKGAAVDTAA